MNSIISFIAFTNISLVFTVIWIRLYTFLIPYLDFLFPPVVANDFYRPQAAFPEPFEIKLYLALTILFAIGVFFLLPILRSVTKLQKKYYIFSLTLLPVLLFSFVFRLGEFPLLHDIYPYSNELYKNMYGVVFFIYSACIIVFITEIIIVSRFLKNHNVVKLFVYGLIFAVSCIITFEPKFPITSLNYAFFYGPAWEIAQGKTIFSQIPSQYGFLSILMLAFFQKIGVDVLFLPVVLWILTTIQYFVCFYLVYKISGSISLSLLGFFSIVTVNYLTYIQSPQSGPLRWLPMILVMLILYKRRSVTSKVFITIVSLLSFWIIDVGIYILFSYITTIGLSYLLKMISLRKALEAVCFLLLSILFIFTLINIGHILLGMHPVDAGAIFKSIVKHANSGLVMIPMPQKTYFWLVPLIYFASIIYLFKYQNQRESEDIRFGGIELSHEMLLFSANLSLFAGIYFVGRSAPDYLFKISTVVLLTLFLLLADVCKTIQKTKMVYLFFTLIFILLIALPAWERKTYISETLIRKYQNILSGQFIRPAYIDQYRHFYKDEVSLIRKYLTTQEVAILSTDDTYLFYLTGKKNLLDANPQVGLDTSMETNQFAKRLNNTCPQALAIDCSVIGKCPIYSTLTAGFNVVPHVFTNLEDSCKTQYEPIHCTNKLCIVEKEK